MISAAAAVNPGFSRFAGGSGSVESLFDRLSAGIRREQPVAAEPDLAERGYAVLRRSLEDRLGLQAPAAQPYAAPEPSDAFDAQHIANAVLGFVAARLQREAESGASADRLRELLSQGRAGFEAGMEQAREDLEALGLLSGKIRDGIAQVSELVHGGLDGLQDRFVDGIAPATASRPASSLVEAARSVRMASSEVLQLEVRTRDGDTVRLNFRESAGYAESSYFSQSDGPEGARTRYGTSQSGFYSARFTVGVEGELDESERAALRDLLGQVDQLADTFFDGDTQTALQQALDMGYDRDEIAGFSLRLTETSVRQVTETYRRVEQLGTQEQASREPANGLRNLGQFLKTMREAVDSARAFADGEGLIADLFRIARQLDPRDLAAGDDTTLQARQNLLDLLNARYGADFSDTPAETETAEPVLAAAA